MPMVGQAAVASEGNLPPPSTTAARPATVSICHQTHTVIEASTRSQRHPHTQGLAQVRKRTPTTASTLNLRSTTFDSIESQ